MRLGERIAKYEEERIERMIDKMNETSGHRGRPKKGNVAEQLDKAKTVIANMKKENEVFFTQESLLKDAGLVTNNQAAKADNGKPQLRLVPMKILTAIARIREYGCKKYHAPDNWKKVEIERYRDAMLRHMAKYIEDPQGNDEESGLPHLWHVACNVAFLVELEKDMYARAK